MPARHESPEATHTPHSETKPSPDIDDYFAATG